MIVQFPRSEIPYLICHILEGVTNDSGGVLVPSFNTGGEIIGDISEWQISTNLLLIINIFSLD